MKNVTIPSIRFFSGSVFHLWMSLTRIIYSSISYMANMVVKISIMMVSSCFTITPKILFFKALSKNLFFKYCHKNKHAPHRFSTWKFNNSRLPLSTIKTKLWNDQSAKCQWFRGLSAPSSCLEARSPCSHFNFYVPEMKKSVQI